MIDDLISQRTADCPGTIHEQLSQDRPQLLTGPVDAMLLLAEWGFRQIYWRNEFLRTWVKRLRTNKRPKTHFVGKRELVDHLNSIGVGAGALVMAHTSVSGLSFEPWTEANKGSGNSMKVAQELVSLLVDQIGETGTLVMPTHPVYKARAGSSDANDQPAIPVFNPKSTPCSVGLANELFWRRHGTERSLFPHNTLAARGPLAAELLRDNLNDVKPLPHGRTSGYYRFCQRNGLLISIGVPLASCFTLVHAAEEARDEQWRVPDFFEERSYIVRSGGVDKTVTIRKTRTAFMMFSLCIRKLRRDLLRAGILHEDRVGSVRVDWAHSGEVFQFISERNRSSSYPYFGTSLVRSKDRGHVSNS